ncbi:MAG: transglutaminase TgpA family protein [Jatrophihabitantaceae bacterium]
MSLGSGARRTGQALLASALAAVPLCQMFVDRGWLVDVWITMLVVVGPALLIRLRRAPGAFQIWPGIVLLVPWLSARFVPQHALFGFLPTAGTMHDLGRLMQDLHHTTQDGVAPVQTTVAVRLALCAVLGLFAALVDLVAVVGHHGALAGVPMLVVYTVAGAVPRHPVDWLFFAVAGAGFLLLLSLDARDEVSSWGHRVPRPGEANRRPALAVSGQRIAALSIAVAIVLPLLAPVTPTNFIANLLHNSGSQDSNGPSGFGSGDGSSIDPFAALRGQLERPQRLNLFTVTVSPKNSVRPFYLRANVLSDFTGNGWVPAAHGAGEKLDATAFATLPPTSASASTVSFDAQVTVAGLSGNPPVFALPATVAGLGGDTLWNPQDQLLLGGAVHSGEQFRESVTQADPSTDELQAANDQTGSPDLAAWLSLPTIPAQVRSLVSQLTAGKTTPYAKARAISDYFSAPGSGFAYSLDTAAGTSGSDLVDFLTNKIGYCQQFAAAMGVMLRLAGVPARVVLGYTHPVPDAGGSFTVTTDDAHAWVEAYFGGLGWIPFDPTPLAGIAGGAANDLPWAPHGKPLAVLPPASSTAPAQQSHASVGLKRPSDTRAAAAGGARTAQGNGAPVLLPLALALLVLSLLALVPVAARTRRRRRRVRAGRSGDADQLWAELSDTATDLGYVWSPARTPRQVASWLDAPPGDSASLRTLANAVEQRRYSAHPQRPAADLSRELALARARLLVGRGRAARLRATFWPASLGWTRLSWVRRLGWTSARTGRDRPIRRSH